MAALADATGATPTTTAGSGGTDWGALIGNVLTSAVAARRQDQVLKLNIQREQQGLPPLDVENYQPGVKVGLDKGTRTVLIVGGVAVSVLLLAMALKK